MLNPFPFDNAFMKQFTSLTMRYIKGSTHVLVVTVLQRIKTNRMCTYREIYFKELAHVIIEVDKSKICRIGRQTKDLGKSRYDRILPSL